MDILSFKILEDGTLEVKTTSVSTGNHMSADALMKNLDELMGGHVEIKKNPDAHQHAHQHGLAHAH